jgi:hypothetical protein
MVIPAFFHGATISIKFVAFNFHSINTVKNKCGKSLKNGFTLNPPSPASEARQSSSNGRTGLPRRFASRNDEAVECYCGLDATNALINIRKMGARMPDAELRLIAWRDGSTKAERLAAAILKLAGYESIDPQGPIGGPDGGKDILCRKGGITSVGAVYFPPTQVTFAKLKNKFLADLAKVSTKHKGFAFITNRPMTPTQRTALETAGSDAGKDVDIFHLERLLTLLNSPQGYGTRLQFLSIPMTTEDQLSWFAESDDRVVDAISINTRELLSMKAILQDIAKDNVNILRTMSQLEAVTPPTPDLLSSANFSAAMSTRPVSGVIDVPMILFTHRLACFDMPKRTVGVLRTTSVWLANPQGERAKYLQPPPADAVPRQLTELCSTWCQQYPALLNSPPLEKLRGISHFHVKLLVIHPFVDGNGRLARALLMQHCLDLFGVANMSLLDKGSGYYRALASADRDDYTPLIELLKPVVNMSGSLAINTGIPD